MHADSRRSTASGAHMRITYVVSLQTVKLFCAESLEVSQYDAATRQYQVRAHLHANACLGLNGES